MRRARIRVALVMLLITTVLTGLWWDSVVDPSARERTFDRIEYGMTIPQVERLMRWPGEVQFNKISGDPEYHAEQWSRYGSPHQYLWDDACSTVFVTFRAPAPNEPVVVDKSFQRKDPPELDRLLRQRFSLIFSWLFSLALLVRGMLTPKPAAALNSPPTSDTKDGAAVDSGDGPQGVALG